MTLGVAVAMATYMFYGFAQLPRDLHQSDTLFEEYVKRKVGRILVCHLITQSSYYSFILLLSILITQYSYYSVILLLIHIITQSSYYSVFLLLNRLHSQLLIDLCTQSFINSIK